MLTALAADFRFSLLSVGLVVDRGAVRPVAELPPRLRWAGAGAGASNMKSSSH
jgi:hypothetical protein